LKTFSLIEKEFPYVTHIGYGLNNIKRDMYVMDVDNVRNTMRAQSEQYLDILRAHNLPLPCFVNQKIEDKFSFQLVWACESLDRGDLTNILQHNINSFLEADKAFTGPFYRFPHFANNNKISHDYLATWTNPTIYDFDTLFCSFTSKRIKAINNEYIYSLSIGNHIGCKMPTKATTVASVAHKKCTVKTQVLAWVGKNWWGNMENKSDNQCVSEIQQYMLRERLVASINPKYAYKCLEIVNYTRQRVMDGEFVRLGSTFDPTPSHWYQKCKDIGIGRRKGYSDKVVAKCALILQNKRVYDISHREMELLCRSDKRKFVGYLNRVYTEDRINGIV